MTVLCCPPEGALPEMSAPPEYRGGAARPAGRPPARVRRSVGSDQGVRPPRTDVLAALVTVVGGSAGLAQLRLSWSSVVSGVGLVDSDGVTGWERYLAARSGGVGSLGNTVTAYSVVSTALAGAALVLLGLAMLLPIDHRPLGVFALVISLGCLGATVWWLVRGHQTFNQSAVDLFRYAGVGWYLFVLAGPIGVLGSARALTAG